jgi:hypothetical protein
MEVLALVRTRALADTSTYYRMMGLEKNTVGNDGVRRIAECLAGSLELVYPEPCFEQLTLDELRSVLDVAQKIIPIPTLQEHRFVFQEAGIER